MNIIIAILTGIITKLILNRLEKIVSLSPIKEIIIIICSSFLVLILMKRKEFREWLRKVPIFFTNPRAPIRSLKTRLTFGNDQLVCIASNAADAHWDKYATSFIMSFLHRKKQSMPIFLPRDRQDWAPFWEAVNKKEFNLFILGSKKQFSFTKYMLKELNRVINPAAQSLNIVEFNQNTRLTPIEYDDVAQLIVVRWLRLRDCYNNEHIFPRLILILGEDGPATLAACYSYLAHPKVFEPKRRVLNILWNERRPVFGRISTLNLKVSRNESSVAYDNRYVKPDSLKIIDSQHFKEGLVNPITRNEKPLSPLNKNIELPIERGNDARHHFCPRKFLVALPNLLNFRNDIRKGKRWPVRWGWKRDSYDFKYTRIVYFSAYLVFDGVNLVCVDPYFYLYHRGDEGDIERLNGQCEIIQNNDTIRFPVSINKTTQSLNFIIGRPRIDDIDLIERFKTRLPEPIISIQPIQPQVSNILTLSPCDLYVGSGLSYEVGIPMMRELHRVFHVDDGNSEFKFSDTDGLIGEIAANWEDTFKKLLMVDIAYIQTPPGISHTIIGNFKNAGTIKNVYSDNVDDLLERAGINTIRTRGNGLFNEKFNVTNGQNRLSNAPYLWVVGISADRRGIVEQARNMGKSIVVINPDYDVSPKSKRLDYLRRGDIFIQNEFQRVVGAFPN